MTAPGDPGGPGSGEPAPVRRAARVLLLDQLGRVLLFGMPHRRPGVTLWMPPGGGLESGESYLTAAAREVFEETGLADVEIGPYLWFRSLSFAWEGRPIQQHERFFLARCQAFVPSDAHLQAHERGLFETHRWWSPEDIVASRDYFVPKALGSLLGEISAGRLPRRPFDCGI